MRKLVISILVFGLAGTASPLNLTFSTDGSTSLPDGATIWPMGGSTTTLYLMSDTGGDTAGYTTYIDMAFQEDAYLPAADDYTIYAAAGNLASVVDYSTGSLYDMELTAADTVPDDGVPLAGVHFAFDLVIGAGPVDPFFFWNTIPGSPTYEEDKRVYVLPEPGTIALLGLGSILVLRRRRRGKAQRGTACSAENRERREALS